MLGLVISYSCIFQVPAHGDFSNSIETTITTNPLEVTQPDIPSMPLLPTDPMKPTESVIPTEPTEPTEPFPQFTAEELKWITRAEEYPVATKVWLFLKEELGYSDAVCAGIIGNMMTECGGQTLNLQWDARNKKSGCYGLCQWHPKYFPELQDTTLEEQLDFAKTSFPKLLSRYMRIYKKGFTYEDFLALEDPCQAAYIFCVVYERPGSGAHTRRQENAMKAYEYFTS